MSAPSPGAPVPLLVAVDDEGGRVERIDGVVGSMPSARDLAADGPEAVRAAAEERARAMADLGITVDFAPVVDLGVQPDRGVIGDRAYAPDPAGVVAGAGAFAAALREAGVLPTLKHFPGHGRAVGDSHDERAVTPPWAEVEDLDLEPYRQLLDDGPAAVMVGHLVVPGLSTDPAVPTSLDPVVYRYLREELGVEGLVVTDDLNGMRAVSDLADGGDAAVRALAAGADMALLASPTGVDALLDRLEAATAGGELPRARVAQAADRVLAWKRCG